MSSFFFPLPDYCLTMRECSCNQSCNWCVVSVFGVSLCCLCLSSNTCSVLRYHQSFLWFCVIRVHLWYGPRV